MSDKVIDVHSHALPMTLLEWLANQGLADIDGDVVRIEPAVSGIGRGSPIPLPRTQYDLEERIADLERMGVDRQLVSLPPFVTCPDEPDPRRVIEIVRRANDALVELLSADAKRFVPLGFVPLGSPAALGEATRCLDELSCAGIALGTHGYGAELDDPRHEQLWAMLAGRRVFVFLHPNAVPGGERLAPYWLPQLAGFPMETALAVSRLVLGGVLDRHELTLCLAHGGGCLPALQGRLDLGWERKEIAHTTQDPPSHYLSRLYYDTATFSTPLLGRIVEDFGVGQVLLGTDYPFDLADLQPRATVAALNLPTDQRQAVEGGTISGLLARRV